MQEEVNEKTVSLCITGGKVTVRLLKQAMMRFLAAIEKEKAEKDTLLELLHFLTTILPSIANKNRVI